jgi:hypothetical protein
MQQPGILQPAEADSPSIGRRRFTEKMSKISSYLYDRFTLSPSRGLRAA